MWRDLTAALGTLVPGAEAIHRIKLNGVDPDAYIAAVLDRRAKGHPISRLDDLLPRRLRP